MASIDEVIEVLENTKDSWKHVSGKFGKEITTFYQKFLEDCKKNSQESRKLGNRVFITELFKENICKLLGSVDLRCKKEELIDVVPEAKELVHKKVDVYIPEKGFIEIKFTLEFNSLGAALFEHSCIDTKKLPFSIVCFFPIKNKIKQIAKFKEVVKNFGYERVSIVSVNPEVAKENDFENIRQMILKLKQNVV